MKVDEFKSTEFMRELLNVFGTLFTTPEENIITENSKAEDMFFICKGDCVVF